MNLSSVLDIFSYGTHEGVEKAWDTRGRGKKEKELSEKALRSKQFYVPLTKEKLKIAHDNEKLIAAAVGGQHIADNKPFDVIMGKVGIEVKTIFPDAKHAKITVHPDSREKKEAFGKKEKLSKMFGIVISMRKGTEGIYIRRFADPNDKHPGWSFRTKFMTRVGSLKDLSAIIKGNKSLERKNKGEV